MNMCRFWHKRNTWKVYVSSKEDIMHLTYNSRKPLVYLPGLHERICSKCGIIETVDLRPKRTEYML